LIDVANVVVEFIVKGNICVVGRESLAWADVDGAHADGSLSQTIMWAKLDVVNTLRKSCTDCGR
jgi:hypothetical protein